MADYPKMYYIVCDGASRAIDAPPEEKDRILRKALEEAEEVYIRTCGEVEIEYVGHTPDPNSKTASEILRMLEG